MFVLIYKRKKKKLPEDLQSNFPDPYLERVGQQYQYQLF